MNNILDEETLVVYNETDEETAQQNRSGRLYNSNLLKNHARYNLAQQKWHLFDNHILRASSGLLSLSVSIKRLQHPDDMYTFRQEIKNLLTDLKYKVAKLDYPPSIADKTCFLFAVMLDEQILHSDWGEESGWENQTLVSELFGIKNGGEQFYQVAERALLQPVLLRELLELIYIMLKLGFKGRYRADGKELLGILTQRLEEAVFAQSAQGEENKKTLFARPQAENSQRAPRPLKPVHWWRSVAMFVVLVAASWAGAHYWYDATSPQKAQAFRTLSDFTAEFYNRANAQEKEYVYRSTPEEMEASAVTYGAANERPTASISNGATVWRVQFATFKVESNAIDFLQKHASIFPNAQVETWRGRFRVIADESSKADAQALMKAANLSGIEDAFIFKDKN